MLRILRNLLFILVIFQSCREEESFFTGSVTLQPSIDTIFFDTVFTDFSPGVPLSVNKQFTIVNPLNQSVKTNISVGGGKESPFRINVDGRVGPEVTDVEILPGDSIYVFVEVSVDPINNGPDYLPLIVRDSIVMSTNGNRQNVQLRAWGQDAHYYLNDTICDMVLDDKLKPYVVHGYLYVPENCVLTIKPGVRFYFAPRSWLYVEGTLKIEGTNAEPVWFEGDRLQPDFEEEAGQWGGIWFDYLSNNNTITHARIKNGTVGIYCDSSASIGSVPNVIVQNTMVRNMSYDGLSGKSCYIRAINSVFDNCGRYSFLGLWGGKYELYHNDFITYGYYFGRKDPTFVLNNIETNEFGQVLRTFNISADVKNCIIDGNLKEEVGFGIDQNKVGSFTFDFNLCKTQQKLDQNNLKNVLINSGDVIFVNYRKYDYHLDPASPAINIGALIGINTDLEGTTRDSKPDAGAFEFH
ncbi:MAG: hypothetical protein GC181_07955 [Bacteroidetes bacterium]|nr:hypothetical protein [Bacteroidota bacterium]